MISVGIIDDHPISRWGIQRALESTSEISVAGTYSSPEQVTVDVDVMLLDLFLADDLPCLGVIRELATSTRVLVVSASRRSADIEACFHAGAHGYVHKGADPDELIDAVSVVGSGGIVGARVGDVLPTAAGCPVLSTRERQVLHFIANGYTHKQAARRLGVSRHTVDTYVKRLRSKLGVGNKAHLTRAALLRSPVGVAGG